MVLLRDLAEAIAPFVPLAPEQALIRAYCDAAREFFTKSRIHRLPLEVSAVAANGTYLLVPGEHLEVFDATHCTYGNRILDKKTREQIAGLTHGATSNTPSYYRIAGVDTLVIAPAPDEGGATIELIAVVRPTRTAEALDEEMVARYAGELESGAIGYALRQPKQKWTDYDGARAYLGLFLDALDRTLGADEGMVGVARRVRYGGI